MTLISKKATVDYLNELTMTTGTIGDVEKNSKTINSIIAKSGVAMPEEHMDEARKLVRSTIQYCSNIVSVASPKYSDDLVDALRSAVDSGIIKIDSGKDLLFKIVKGEY